MSEEPQEKPKEEQIFPAPKQPTVEEVQKQVQVLTQQNSSLITILQGVVIALDKISRSQSTNLGTISTQLENVLEAIKKSNQPQ